MIEKDDVAVPAAAIDDARQWLRIDGTGEDATLTRLLGAALEACEAEIGRAPIVRGYRERFEMRGSWQTLGATPVRSIGGAWGVEDGVPTAPLPGDAYELDILPTGRGRVRTIVLPGAPGIELHYRAGLSEEWETLSPALRLGLLQLVAGWQGGREGGVPMAVISLWRPHRMLRLKFAA